MQSKCTRFCLRLDKMHYISLTEFKSINWLATLERVHQCINVITFKLVDKNCLFYLNEIFEFNWLHIVEETQETVLQNFKHPFCKTNTAQKTLSHIGPSLWNNLPDLIKN